MERVSFEDLWGLLAPEGEYCRRRKACERLWESFNAERRQAIYGILQAKKRKGAYVSPNPYYAIDDNDHPVFLSGLEQDRVRAAGIRMVLVKYQGRYAVCTHEMMVGYALEYVREA